jgi:hypothetical protein
MKNSGGVAVAVVVLVVVVVVFSKAFGVVNVFLLSQVELSTALQAQSVYMSTWKCRIDSYIIWQNLLPYSDIIITELM